MSLAVKPLNSSRLASSLQPRAVSSSPRSDRTDPRKNPVTYQSVNKRSSLSPSSIAACFILLAPALHAADGTWNVNTDGLWSLNTNWLSNTIADGSGSTANFTTDITADRTVSLDGDRT
jgi:hypothetical protein